MEAEYEQALAAAEQAVRHKPLRSTPHRAVVAALYCLGRREDLARAAALYREAVPGARVQAAALTRRFADQPLAALLCKALRAAGLPE